jgi:hypothetical protein
MIPGEEQHSMLIAVFKHLNGMKHVQNKYVPKRKIWMLKKPDVKQLFEDRIKQNWKGVNEDDDTNAVWSKY